MWGFHNGKVFEKAEETKLSIYDLSIFRGAGIFDYFRIMHGHPLFIKNHIARFKGSVRHFGFEIPQSEEQIIKAVYEIAEKNNMPNGAIRFLFTPGYSETAYLATGDPNFFILQESHQAPHKDNYEKGGKLLLEEHMRHMPTFKTTSYFFSVSTFKKSGDASYTDVLYHNNGQILEASRANVFVVIGGILVTPRENILTGITRSAVFKLAAENSLEVLEAELNLGVLSTVDELFITGSGKEIMPIVQVGKTTIGDGKVGPVSKKLMKAMSDLTEEHRHSPRLSV